MSNFDLDTYIREKAKSLDLVIHDNHSRVSTHAKAYVISKKVDYLNSCVLTNGGTDSLDDDEAKKVIDKRLGNIVDMLNGVKK